MKPSKFKILCLLLALALAACEGGTDSGNTGTPGTNKGEDLNISSLVEGNKWQSLCMGPNGLLRSSQLNAEIQSIRLELTAATGNQDGRLGVLGFKDQECLQEAQYLEGFNLKENSGEVVLSDGYSQLGSMQVSYSRNPELGVVLSIGNLETQRLSTENQDISFYSFLKVDATELLISNYKNLAKTAFFKTFSSSNLCMNRNASIPALAFEIVKDHSVSSYVLALDVHSGKIYLSYQHSKNATDESEAKVASGLEEITEWTVDRTEPVIELYGVSGFIGGSLEIYPENLEKNRFHEDNDMGALQNMEPAQISASVFCQ